MKYKLTVSLSLALSLLTRLPVPKIETITPKDSGDSALFYPFVGLLIGLILYLPVFLFPNGSPLLLAALMTLIWVMVTGGLHLDGLADSADGWLGGLSSKEKSLEIMKDPVVGAAGAIALICLLLLKFAVLATLLEGALQDTTTSVTGLIIIAPFVGRSMILLLFVTSKNANPDSMANEVVNNLSRNTILRLLGACLLLATFFSFTGMVLALIVFWFMRRLMQHRLGGYTGDTLGATVEATEVFFLVGYALS